MIKFSNFDFKKYKHECIKNCYQSLMVPYLDYENRILRTQKKLIDVDEAAQVDRGHSEGGDNLKGQKILFQVWYFW